MKENQNKNPGMAGKGSQGKNVNAGEGRQAGQEKNAGKQSQQSNRQPKVEEDDIE